MRIGRLYFIRHFNVTLFIPSEYLFLFLDRQRLKRLQIMNVFLNKQITSPLIGRVLIPDQPKKGTFFTFRIFGTIDKS
jgi:hypothetical protein